MRILALLILLFVSVQIVLSSKLSIYCKNNSIGKMLSPKDSVFVFPSAREISVEITSYAAIEEGEIEYFYTLKSFEDSKQNIDTWFLKIRTGLYDIKSPVCWSEITGTPLSILSWSTSDSVCYINPDNTLTGFSYKSKAFPGIIKYYVTGYFPIPVFPLGEEPGRVEGNSIFENSVQGYTIGPKDVPSPFVLLEFLDTLTNYTSQSFELGWIKDEQTKSRYNNYFTGAKDALTKGDIFSARTYLQNVLSDAETDSASALSSEAYALLRYNTEYLLKQIGQ